MNDRGLGIMLIAASPIFLWVLRGAFRTGEIQLPALPTTWVSRSEQPYMFWVFVASNVAFFVALIGLGLRELLAGL